MASPETDSEQVPSLLGGALGMEFSDCSIAAADLSHLVHKKFKDHEKYADRLSVTADYYVVDNVEYRSSFDVLEVDVAKSSQFYVDGRPVDLVVIATPVSKAESIMAPAPATKRRWLGAKAVSAPATREIPAAPAERLPMLAAKIGADTLLPLATFALRADGLCSYVQLGSEIHDDSIYVTASDDETPRYRIIESLRALLRQNPATPYTAENQQYIQAFIDGQAQRRSEQLLVAYEAALVRKASWELHKSMNKQGLLPIPAYVYRPGRESVPQDYVHHWLSYPLIDASGRRLQLALTQNGNARQLVARTGGGVEVVVANLLPDQGQVVMDEAFSLLPEAKQQLVLGLYDLLLDPLDGKHSQEAVRKAVGYRGPQIVNDSAELTLAVTLGQKYGHLFSSRDEIMSGHNNYHDSDRTREAPRALKRFFRYPSQENNPYPDSPSLQTVLARIANRDSRPAALLELLHVSQRLDEYLGETRPGDQLLLSYVTNLELLGTAATGTFKDLRIGATTGDADISAQVVRRDHLLELQISGRPSSMQRSPMKPLFSFLLDPTRPLLGQDQDRNILRDPQSVAQINDILSGLLDRNRS
ncbi:MAG: hypothetical protein JWN38_534 [Candidatus Saccharibacteria bacterium]|nr:hypothetical protein [Candidatus Saccharibacteria bacterium]